MRFVLGWSVFIGFTWFCGLIVLQLIAIYLPNQKDDILRIYENLYASGQSLAQFISPVLQLALILAILISVAEKLGFKPGNLANFSNLTEIAASKNVQAFIAIFIVVALIIAALANIQRIDVLKDLALVVVGFYFGARRRDDELNPENKSSQINYTHDSNQNFKETSSGQVLNQENIIEENKRGIPNNIDPPTSYRGEGSNDIEERMRRGYTENRGNKDESK